MPRVQLTTKYTGFPFAKIAMAALCALPISSAHAVTTGWNTNSSGNFTSAANWDAGVPHSEDTAVFNRGNVAYTVTFSGGSVLDPPPSYLINYLRVNTNEVTFADNSSPFITSPILTVFNPDVSIVVGENAGDVAVLNTTLSSLSAANASIGRAAGANGTLNVVAGMLSMSGTLDVGVLGTGALNVTGGAVSSSFAYIGKSSTGTASVTGAGSIWTTEHLEIGRYRAGLLTIGAGGNVSSDYATIGVYSNFQNTATVTGAGSSWSNTNSLHVAYEGTGTLVIGAGGHVSSAGGEVGVLEGSYGTVTVTGAGSTWTISSFFEIGSLGFGIVTIGDGGIVSNGSIAAIGPHSSVTVTGAGSTWTSGGALYVRRRLDITDGGAVSSGSGYVIGNTLYGRGRVTVDGLGSTWTIAGDLTVGGDEFDLFLSDTLVVSGGGAVSVGGLLLVEPGGTVAGNGTLLATVVNRGVVSPDSPGGLDIDGGYLQSATGKLQLRLGETTPGIDHAQLRVSGAVALNGSLTVDKADSFEPSAGGAFDILDWGSLSGAFSAISLPPLATGLIWDTSQLYTAGILSVVGPPMLEADFDDDGDVDHDDLLQWRGDYDLNGFSDADDDGDSDGADFLAWQRQVGSGVTASAAAGGVPEPISARVAILALGSVFFAYPSRFRRLQIHGRPKTGLLVLAALVAHGSTTRAADDFWKTAASGVWGNGANWLDGAAPGTSDAAFFNQAGAYTVSFNGSPFPIQELTVTNSANLTFGSASIFDLSTLQVTSASGSRDVLVTNDATLILGAPGGLFQPDRPLHLVAGDELIVQSGATLNVRFGSAVTTHWVNISSGGQVNIVGSASTLTNASYLTVGTSVAGIAVMTIQNGGAVLNNVSYVGGSASSVGIVTVTGAGSTWTNSNWIVVGAGSGQMIVQDGGSVTSFSGTLGWLGGSSGTVGISGAGSNWLISDFLLVGDSGAGQLTISDGGSVSNVEGTLGLNPGSSGAVTVSGAASSWTNTGGLYVGKEDSGSLTIQAGGSVSSTFGRVGHSERLASPNPTSTAVINGAGSTWTNSGELLVGGYSDGAMTISGAGSVSSNGGAIGDGAGISSEVANVLLVGNGTVTITGAGSSWTSSAELYVGNHGIGTLTIESGGTVTSTNAAIGRSADRTHANSAYRYSSRGAVNVTGAGSSWTINGRLSMGGDAISGIAGGAGTLDIGPGGKVDVTQDAILFPNSTLKLQGGTLATTTIDFRGGDFQWTSGTLHIGAYHRDLTNPAGGTLAPGRSAGSTTIHGSYTQQSGAALEIEIGGTIIATEHDFVNVVGAAILAGELELKLIDDFTPQATDTFTVFNAAGGIAGVLSNIATGQRLTTSGGLGSFLVHYGATSAFNPNQIVLSAFERSLMADFDEDGDVDGADLAKWKAGFGTTSAATHMQGDADSDQNVDGADFLAWQRQLGSGANSPGVAIPEPSSLAMLTLTVPALLLCRASARN